MDPQSAMTRIGILDQTGPTSTGETRRTGKQPFPWGKVVTMVAFLLLGKSIPPQFIVLMKGAATAIGNHLFFVHFDQQPQDAIAQSTLNAISVAMAFIFKTCIGFALLTAFTQLLWLTLRERWLEATSIDRLFSSPNSLKALLHIRPATKAPVTWTLALLCWLVPFATIFPPGAISVVGISSNAMVEKLVPTFNSSANTSSLVGWGGAATDCYGGAGQETLRMASMTMLGGIPLPFSSPCGPNCSYDIGFRGPAWNCQNSTADADNPFGPASTFSSGPAVFLYTAIVNDVFWLWYSAPMGTSNPVSSQVISCRIYVAWYDITIRFSDSVLFYDKINVTLEDPWVGLNRTNLSAVCLPSITGTDPGPFWDNLNIGAISSAVATQLDGNITFTSISP